MTPSKLAPGIGISLLTVAPVAMTTASKSFSNWLALISFPISILHLNIIPSAFKISSLLSITLFSILKSGIP